MARQFRLAWPIILAVAVAAGVLTAVVLVLAELKGIDPDSLTRDPTATARIPYYFGFLTHFGILVWGGTVVVCLFAASGARRARGSGRLSAFLLASAAFSLVLGLDDIFQLHEQLPLHTGVPKAFVFVAYLLLGGFYLFLFLPIIRKTESILLVAAVALFALSVALEARVTPYYLQDIVKFAGQLLLLLYFYRTGLTGVRPDEGVESRPNGPSSNASGPGGRA